MSNRTDLDGNPPPVPPYHPSVAAVLQYFDYRHLPTHMAKVSKGFVEIAFHLADTIPPSDELTVALRKLLESKDAAVRASRPMVADVSALCVDLANEVAK